MWILVLFGVIWLGVLIYEFSTGQLLSWGTPRLFGREIEPDSEAFWRFTPSACLVSCFLLLIWFGCFISRVANGGVRGIPQGLKPLVFA